MRWIQLDPRATEDHMGFIPAFLSDADARTAQAQFADNYIGGWNPFPGFVLTADLRLHYKDDPPMVALWLSKLRDETIVIYEHAWVMIQQADGAFEVSRMD